jgi:oxygen-dependent protoporphyrinogen oxidase
VRYAFPTLHRFDRDHGSLVFGAMAAGRARRRSGTPRFKSRSISFRNGLQAIIDALVHHVGDSLFTNASLEKLEPGARWRVTSRRPGAGSESIEVEAVAVALPGYAAAELPFDEAAGRPLAALGGITYPPVTTVALGFQRDHVAHPLDGYGVLVPQRENLHTLGTLFSSSLFPGRAPEGCVLVTSFVGGMRQPDIASLPRNALLDLVLGDLRQLLGVRGDPVFVHTHAWDRAIPQYNLGYGHFHAVMDDAEKRLPGLYVGGQCRDGVSVGDCIRAGLNLATRIASASS